MSFNLCSLSNFSSSWCVLVIDNQSSWLIILQLDVSVLSYLVHETLLIQFLLIFKFHSLMCISYWWSRENWLIILQISSFACMNKSVTCINEWLNCSSCHINIRMIFSYEVSENKKKWQWLSHLLCTQIKVIWLEYQKKLKKVYNYFVIISKQQKVIL